MLTAVDKLEVHIVDNATDSLSTTSGHVESEFSYLRRKGMRVLTGRCLCCANHGLSCLITARRGTQSHVVLFDTGPKADTFERNADRLAVDLTAIESIVLSHGHWDHSGGMLRALDLIRVRDRQRSIPFYAHPAMFRSRARQLPNGEMLPMEDVPGVVALTEHGRTWLQPRATDIPGRHVPYQRRDPPHHAVRAGLPLHYQRSMDGERWEADPWIVDERWLGVHVADTVQALKRFGLTTIAAGHCTGWRAIASLLNAFGDEVLTPLAVGKRFVF